MILFPAKVEVPGGYEFCVVAGGGRALLSSVQLYSLLPGQTCCSRTEKSTALGETEMTGGANISRKGALVSGL